MNATSGERRCRVGRAIVGCLLIPLLATAASARSTADPGSVTRARFQELAARSIHDERALAALRAVRSVDGQPVDVNGALSGAGGAALDVRLRQLAAGVGSSAGTGAGGTGAATRARRDAAHVLAGDNYRSRSVPRPFRGILAWIGDRLAPVFGPIGRFFAAVFDNGIGRLALLALVVGLAVATASRLVRGRSRAALAGAARRSGHLVDPAADPEVLDDRAAAAEAAGRHGAGVRLRYQAGLIRLDRSRVIDLRPDTTTGDVARQVASPVLDQLTSSFEEIVYGGRQAGPADSAAAREGWLVLLGTTANR